MTQQPPKQAVVSAHHPLWSEVADSQHYDAVALMQLPLEPQVLGIVSGSMSILAREVRTADRLGPSISLVTAEAGDLVSLPADGEGIELTIWADDECTAVRLQPMPGDGRIVGDVHGVLGSQFGSNADIDAWLGALQGPEDGALTWSVLLDELPRQARRHAESMVAAEREMFASQLARSESLSGTMLHSAMGRVAESDRMLSARDRISGVNPIDAACRIVADALGADVPDQITYNADSPLSLLEQFSRASHLHRRKVLLQGVWWTDEAGPLFTLRREDQAPVALVPSRRGYVAHVCTEGGVDEVPVDEAFAATLADHAEMLYCGLPARAIGLKDILRFIFRGNANDAVTLVIATLLTSGLVALIPIVTGKVVDEVIPDVAFNALFFIGILLIAISLCKALLHVVSGIAFLRIETRSSFALMAAFVDRLLQLPASFYRGRSAGDLTQRVMAIEKVRATMTQSVLSVLMSFVAGLSNLAVLFVYDVAMSIWAVGMVVLQVLVIGFISVYLARRNYELSVEKGKLDGMALDVLNGIRQARVQGSLQRVLARLMDGLSPVATCTYRIGIMRGTNRIVLNGFKGITLAIVFVLFTMHLHESGDAPMSDGGFVAFVTALTAFFGATAMLGPAISTIAEAIPQYHRLKPIMDARPEVQDDVELDSPVLQGGVAVHNVVFRYENDLPPVLDGVTVEVKRGEYVAIVGRTGCGKSTLMSLLLGLERPESGAVLYDEMPLDNLDPSMIRSQVGVVMQANSVLPGSIKSTILGIGSERTVDDARAAARLVGMEDEIDNLPMGMLTMVGPNTLSGSQAQRLLVARALVNQPRILFLDEATSALDNRSQAEIAASIESLGCTRIVIAHRLSTIRNADRIYVLKEGRVVESGTFDELAGADGHFCELMAGQLS